jgi:hypothetical protein
MPAMLSTLRPVFSDEASKRRGALGHLVQRGRKLIDGARLLRRRRGLFGGRGLDLVDRRRQLHRGALDALDQRQQVLAHLVEGPRQDAQFIAAAHHHRRAQFAAGDALRAGHQLVDGRNDWARDPEQDQQTDQGADHHRDTQHPLRNGAGLPELIGLTADIAPRIGGQGLGVLDDGRADVAQCVLFAFDPRVQFGGALARAVTRVPASRSCAE